jgi:hypothetical protein
MKEKELKSWSEFTDILSEIKGEINEAEKPEGAASNLILYRGQSNSTWLLNTTLERYSADSWLVQDYINLLAKCAPEIESFMDREWKFSNTVWKWGLPLPGLDFWIHVRHCGFPSPILDWTESPYIAAFFALQEKSSHDEKASIFVYTEHPGGFKSEWEVEPSISVIQGNLKTHKRHFLQQSKYTLCMQPLSKGYSFVSHQLVFNGLDSQRGRQDVLYKISIPRSERFKALSSLNEMNINSFSLIQSEESLMASLAFKYIDNLS